TMPIERYKRFIAALVVVQIIAYVFYILIPGHIVRPALDEPGFFSSVCKAIFTIDRPNTLSPSLHVANSWLIFLMLSKRPVVRGILLTWALLIIASTLLIKQHYVIDVISGLF